MGDRVAYIGGSTIGHDHFPFPVEEDDLADVGEGTDYPIGFSLEDALFLYCVCRTPAFAGTYPTNTSSGSFDPVEGAAGGTTFYDHDREDDKYTYIGNTKQIEGEFTREADTVVGRGWSIASDLQEFLASSPNIALRFTCEFDPLNMLKSGELFYPLLVVTAQTANSDDFEDGFWLASGGFAGNQEPYASSSVVNPDTAVRRGIATLTLRGVDYDFGVYDLNDTGAAVDDHSFEITFEDPFWAYSTSLGTPVYDTTDGSQINDPFS